MTLYMIQVPGPIPPPPGKGGMVPIPLPRGGVLAPQMCEKSAANLPKRPPRSPSEPRPPTTGGEESRKLRARAVQLNFVGFSAGNALESQPIRANPCHHKGGEAAKLPHHRGEGARGPTSQPQGGRGSHSGTNQAPNLHTTGGSEGTISQQTTVPRGGEPGTWYRQGGPVN